MSDTTKLNRIGKVRSVTRKAFKSLGLGKNLGLLLGHDFRDVAYEQIKKLMTELKLPRLLAAAKEFNIGQEIGRASCRERVLASV